MENIDIARKNTYFIFINIMEHIFYRIMVLVTTAALSHILLHSIMFPGLKLSYEPKLEN